MGMTHRAAPGRDVRDPDRSPAYGLPGARRTCLRIDGRALPSLHAQPQCSGANRSRHGPPAEQWLAANTANRPLSRSTVRGFADAMRSGEWLVTHQGVAFDTDGVLVDGQHRLAAI